MTRAGLFITGTDTGVGKTTITASILRRLAGDGVSVGVMKPIATGSNEDAIRLRAALGLDVPLSLIAPMNFLTPAAPSVAARMEGTPLLFDRILESVERCWSAWDVEQGRSTLLIEGVGGFLCPIAEKATVADLATTLDLPLVIVARRALGTLNHTLLTLEAARNRDLRVAGLVLVAAQPSENTEVDGRNAGELMRHLEDVPILADVPYTTNVDLIDSCMASVEWSGLMRPGRLCGS